MREHTLNKLFEKMNNVKGFPALEETISSILVHLTDPAKGSRDLVTLVVSDFTLTQKILKLVNSAMYAPFTRNVVTISEALNIIGTDALSHIVLSITVASSLDDEHALAKTLLSSEVARTVCLDSDRELAAISALLYDMGNLITLKYLPDERRAMATLVQGGIDPEDAAKKVLGTSLVDIGVAIATKWKYPAKLTSIINGTGDSKLVNIAKFSTQSANLLYEKRTDELAKLVESFNLSDDVKSKLTGMLEDKGKKIEQIVATVVNVSDSSKALIDLLDVLDTTFIDKLDDLSNRVFAVFHNAFRTSHCLLMLQTRAGDFHVRCCHGRGVEEIRAKFKIPAKFQPTAFHAVIKNNVDIAIDDVSKLSKTSLTDGYSSLFPNVAKFIILPIGNSSVTGLLYFDWENHIEISAAELILIRKLRDRFTPFFPK